MRLLTSKYPAKQDGEHAVRICELTIKENKENHIHEKNPEGEY